MTFTSPSYLPSLEESQIPDDVALCDFVFNERYGRAPFAQSKDAFTCGLTGRSISALDQRKRVDLLARALSKEMGWRVNEGNEFDKVVGIFALNTVSQSSNHTHKNIAFDLELLTPTR